MWFNVKLFLSHEDRNLVRELMAKADELKAATAGLDASVAALAARVAALPQGGSVSDADVDAAIADINVQKAAVDAIAPATPVA